MRAFELILSSICIVMIVQDLFIQRRKIDKDLLALVLSLSIALHIVMEGSRWQLTGIYIVVLYEVILALKGYLFNKRDKDKSLKSKKNKRISWFFLIVVMVTIVLALLFPVN